MLIKIHHGRAERNRENNSKRENIIPAEMELMNGEKNDAVMILTWDPSNKEISRNAWSGINKWVVETSKMAEYNYYMQKGAWALIVVTACSDFSIKSKGLWTRWEKTQQPLERVVFYLWAFKVIFASHNWCLCPQCLSSLKLKKQLSEFLLILF